MTPLGVNYLCCVAVLALGFPLEKAFLDRLPRQYRERFCRCTSGRRKTIKASHRMPLPQDTDLSSIWVLQFFLPRCHMDTHKACGSVAANSLEHFFYFPTWAAQLSRNGLSNRVWIYTKAGLVVEARGWVCAATDCVNLYIMDIENFFFTGKSEKQPHLWFFVLPTTTNLL